VVCVGALVSSRVSRRISETSFGPSRTGFRTVVLLSFRIKVDGTVIEYWGDLTSSEIGRWPIGSVSEKLYERSARSQNFRGLLGSNAKSFPKTSDDFVL
jgi:hypothetical protein